MSKLDAFFIAVAVVVLCAVMAWFEGAKADCRKAGGVPVRGVGITPIECIKQTKEPTNDR